MVILDWRGAGLDGVARCPICECVHHGPFVLLTHRFYLMSLAYPRQPPRWE